MDYFDKDQSKILNLKHGNVNVSMGDFVDNMNDLLDKHAPFKKISKYKAWLFEGSFSWGGGEGEGGEGGREGSI